MGNINPIGYDATTGQLRPVSPDDSLVVGAAPLAITGTSISNGGALSVGNPSQILTFPGHVVFAEPNYPTINGPPSSDFTIFAANGTGTASGQNMEIGPGDSSGLNQLGIAMDIYGGGSTGNTDGGSITMRMTSAGVSSSTLNPWRVRFTFTPNYLLVFGPGTAGSGPEIALKPSSISSATALQIRNTSDNAFRDIECRTGTFLTSAIIGTGTTITVAGTAVTGSGALSLTATAATLALAATGTNIVTFSTAGTEAARFTSGQKFLIGTITDTFAKVNIYGDSAISDANRVTLNMIDTTTQAAGVGSGIAFGGMTNGTTLPAGWAGIKGVKFNSTVGDAGGELAFLVRPAGASGGTLVTEVARFKNDGALNFPTNTTAAVSAATTGSLRYNNTTPAFEVSMAGAAWTAINATKSGVRAVTSAIQTVAHGATVELAFAAADSWDDNGWHDPVTNNSRLTVPAGTAANARIMIFHFTAWTAPFIGLTQMTINRYSAGDVLLESTADQYDQDASVSGSRFAIRSYIMQTNPGEYFVLTAYQQSGASRDVVTGAHFGAQLL